MNRALHRSAAKCSSWLAASKCPCIKAGAMKNRSRTISRIRILFTFDLHTWSSSIKKISLTPKYSETVRSLHRDRGRSRTVMWCSMWCTAGATSHRCWCHRCNQSNPYLFCSDLTCFPGTYISTSLVFSRVCSQFVHLQLMAEYLPLYKTSQVPLIFKVWRYTFYRFNFSISVFSKKIKNKKSKIATLRIVKQKKWKKGTWWNRNSKVAMAQHTSRRNQLEQKRHNVSEKMQ